jgi:heptosyltransferase-2
VKRILIIQTAFLGDVILATPVVSELKRLYPEAEIDVVVKKGNEGLLENHVDVHRVFVFDKGAGKWKALRLLIKEFRKRSYDLAINLHRFGSSGYMTVRSGAKKRYGFAANPFSFLYTKRFAHRIGDGTHEVERNLSLIREFGAEARVRPSLYPNGADFETAAPYKDTPYFCLAPASVWFTKQLPEEQWIALITKLGKDKIYLLGAPGDHALCERIRNASGEHVVNLAGKLSLLASAALMKDARRCYVNDSGPLHLASAMNAPTTAFFCSTVTDFGFGPLADDAVVREVKNLDCRPCGLHGHKSCPKGHFKCGREIAIDA